MHTHKHMAYVIHAPARGFTLHHYLTVGSSKMPRNTAMHQLRSGGRRLDINKAGFKNIPPKICFAKFYMRKEINSASLSGFKGTHNALIMNINTTTPQGIFKATECNCLWLTVDVQLHLNVLLQIPISSFAMVSGVFEEGVVLCLLWVWPVLSCVQATKSKSVLTVAD